MFKLFENVNLLEFIAIFLSEINSGMRNLGHSSYIGKCHFSLGNYDQEERDYYFSNSDKGRIEVQRIYLYQRMFSYDPGGYEHRFFERVRIIYRLVVDGKVLFWENYRPIFNFRLKPIARLYKQLQKKYIKS